MEYNVALLESRVSNFRAKNYRFDEVSLFFDIDNSLGLFSIKGKEDEALRKMFLKGYYRNIPCFEEAPTVLEVLKKLGGQEHLLSSCPETPYGFGEKLDWAKYYFPFIPQEQVFIIPMGVNKAEFVKDKGFDISKSILLDDYGPNLASWYEAGGIGIKKTYSEKPRPILQVGSLIELFDVLFNPQKLNLRL